MNELSAQAAFDHASLSQNIHQAKENNGNGECKKRSDIRRHGSSKLKP
jgi:hypothetical protein